MWLRADGASIDPFVSSFVVVALVCLRFICYIVIDFRVLIRLIL